MTEANSTRLAYRDALVTAMGANERIVCLDTDTGLFAGVDFGPASDRYLNLGIAEQNALSLAAALALDGWRPHVITMAAFAESRAAEAVKIDVALNAAPVCIAATHAGLSSGTLGPTHHALSDLAVMRVLPNMTVLVPADADAAGALVGQLAALTGPVYLRLGRLATDPLPASAPPVIGELQPLRPGHDVVILACGPHPVLASLGAARELAAAGISAAVLNAHTVKPFDEAALIEAVRPARLVVTVEEHWCAGGLGGMVAEVLSRRLPRPLMTFGVPDVFAARVGDHEHLLRHFGITPAAIAAGVGYALGWRSADAVARGAEANSTLLRLAKSPG